MKANLPYLVKDTDRHGNIRYYVRIKDQPKTRIKSVLGTPEFAAEYAEAVKGTVPRAARQEAVEGTLGWLVGQYCTSPKFRALASQSQRTRRGVLDGCLAENDGDGPPMSAMPIARITAQEVMWLMERKEGMPAAANNRKKYLSTMFKWAVKHNLMTSNPCRDAERVQYASEGFHAWTVEEVRAFEKRWPLGSKPRVSLALLLYTGARRGDMVKLGKQNIKNGSLVYVPSKTAYRRTSASQKPIVPQLAEALAAGPVGDMVFLVTEFGKPFTAAGFGNWFRERCNEAGLPHCTAHGLKKAGATLVAESGATAAQMMALFDWTDFRIPETYIRSANRTKLAADAAKKAWGE